MDPASAIGVAAAVIQFVSLSITVTKRINEYVNASPGNVPKSLQNIVTTLPLITKSLERLQDESELARYDPETRTILHGVVLGCFRLTRELDQLANKIGLKPGESLGIKLKKVVQSFSSEDRIQEIDRGLQAFIQVLVLHQVVNKKDVQLRPSKAIKYYEVKAVRPRDALPREKLVSRIHAFFSDAVKGTTETPVFLTLGGAPGVGKSQLALEYCQAAHALDHYNAMFWIDASGPASLRAGLGSIASTVRQSKTGSDEEKAVFANEFLSDSWHSWLLVLDGYKPGAFDTKQLASLLPAAGHGAVLITTSDDQVMPVLGELMSIYKFVTPQEEESRQKQMEWELGKKNLDYVVDALNREFDVNSFTKDTWGSQPQAMICRAAEVGFKEAVQLFLDLGADPDHPKSPSSALGRATHKRHLDIIEMLFDHEDNTGYRFGDFNYDAAFAGCIRGDGHEVLKLLISRRKVRLRPDANHPGEAFGEAAENGNIDSLRFLMKNDLFPTQEKWLGTALVKAIKWHQLETIDFLLNEAHIDANTLDLYGDLPLNATLDNYVRVRGENGGSSEKVSQEQRRALISRLLDAGAEINRTNKEKGYTALHAAASNYIVSSMPLLFERGADALVKNHDGENPLQLAARLDREGALPVLASAKIADPEARKKYLSEALILAAKNGNRELALQTLDEANVNLRDERDGETPLLIAIKRNQLPMARMLLRKGADQNVKDKGGKAPLILATELGMDTLIRDMIKAKDSPGVDAGDGKGFTPLQIAVKKRHLKTIETLLGLGADKEAMNMFGETALDLAEESGNKELLKLLNG